MSDVPSPVVGPSVPDDPAHITPMVDGIPYQHGVPVADPTQEPNWTANPVIYSSGAPDEAWGGPRVPGIAPVAQPSGHYIVEQSSEEIKNKAGGQTT